MNPRIVIAVVGAIVVLVGGQIFINNLNKKKRYEAKVKAGIIKEGEPVAHASEEEKKAQVDEALDLLKKKD